ncbi:cellulase family glycosylhydrolase [Puia dinghuensis]|uniref:Glycoside hydrolase family 5 domain-containing protein n=1 Tax=Puia dinghuensis TaxID=1792502 RepID=A0A8J2U630_9BACT|nr:cellulase family glycosylhydrolase [Puia dinghuensis]GGA81168.1 hypothetical protein GCM10011511_00170 [Puia dinghuensis]
MQDASNEAGLLSNGVNLQPSYFHGGDVDLGWSLMKAYPKIRTVRIEIEPGQEKNGRRWIAEAKAHGYTVIATYHKHKAIMSDDPTELIAAGEWWKSHYLTLGGGGFFVNLMNEWGSHSIGVSAFAAAYNQAIALVREIYSGPIIIDCPGGGQGTTLLAAAVEGRDGMGITDSNIILSAHFYPHGYNGVKKKRSQIDDLDDLENTGKPCIIGEFGDDPAIQGETNWSAIIDYARSKGWPVLGWAWNGDGGKMNMISPQFQPFDAVATKQYHISNHFVTIYNRL